MRAHMRTAIVALLGIILLALFAIVFGATVELADANTDERDCALRLLTANGGDEPCGAKRG